MDAGGHPNRVRKWEDLLGARETPDLLWPANWCTLRRRIRIELSPRWNEKAGVDGMRYAPVAPRSLADKKKSPASRKPTAARDGRRPKASHSS